MSGQVKKTNSIAKKLNASISRQRFFRDVFRDLVIALCAILLWCATVETVSGGSFTNVTDRGFADAYSGMPVNWVEKLSGGMSRFFFSVFGGELQLPVRGVSYTFAVDGVERVVSADLILSGAILGFALFLVIRLFGVLFRGTFGGRRFKRYLKPIDDIAMQAEELSTATIRPMEVEDDVPIEELETLATAINKIDDSGKRITVHQSELGGLEAAVNNMLRRLEEAERKQIRFVDDASHELRTPIAVIQGYAGMLDRWGKEDPAIRDEAISAIMKESEHMRTLIDQLLFLARGEMDRHKLEKTTLDARAVVEEIYEESVMLDREHKYLLLPAAPGDYSFTADEAMLKQAVRIVRDNAMRYTPAGGEVKFRTYLREDSVCIEVTDTGIGIHESELPRIFDRFYRGSNARGDNTGGSGLGLSIAKWIIEEHGGHIEAISGSGIGTKMTFVMKRE